VGGLYDGDKGGKEFTFTVAENSEYLQIGENRIHPRSFSKMLNTVDTALRNKKPSQETKLTYTMTADLIGYNSSEPSGSTNHLWRKASEAFRGHKKSTNIFVGSLVRWRIVLLAKLSNNIWITMADETDMVDPESGKTISRSCYWINNDWNPPKKRKTKGFTVADLADKFNN